MIRIEKLTRGRWGNKLLHYNSLMQIACRFNIEPSCGSWDTDKEFWWDTNRYFDDICGYKLPNKIIKNLSWEHILNPDFELFKFDNNYDYKLDDYALHNVFFKLTKKDPREFLKLKHQYKIDLDSSYINVGIHFRGGDVLIADNGKEIHSPEYYINSIKLIEKEFENKKIKYYVCTDDKTFDTYLITTNYLIDNNLNWEEGSNSIKNKTIQDSDKDFIYDFNLLTECDILINSSSTFCICAGVLGKKDKKIIHYKKWLDRCFQHLPWNNKETSESLRQWQLSFDNFWVDLYGGGNEFYKIWKIVDNK